MSLTFKFDPGGNNELTLDRGDIISHNPVRTHTGLSDLSAVLIENRSLDDYAQRQDRLNVLFNGTVKWTGYLVGVNHSPSRGETRIRADGIAKRLQETRPDYDSLGGSKVYSNISLENALDDYWGRTPFSNYSVTSQSTSTVATDTVLQEADTDSEFSSILSIGSNDPFSISGGKLRLQQSAYHIEGEQFNLTATVSDSEASESNAESMASQLTDSVSRSLDYSIPSSDAKLGLRLRNPNDPDSDGDYEGHGFQVSVDGNAVNSFSDSWVRTNDDYFWDTTDINSDISGSTTVEITGSGFSGEQTNIDLVVIYDDRYTYNFDNTVDADNHLSGPELYPDVDSIVFDEEKASFNIQDATVNLTINDTSGGQAIGISFDSGNSYDTGNNTSTHTAQPSGSSRRAQVKLSLSRFGTGNSGTPTDGYKNQTVDFHELLVDGNDLVVIDELELSRNHFENLQQLHEYGENWNWTIEHDDSDISNMTVKSYQEGDETRSKPSSFTDPIDESPEVQSEAYFNSIFIQGEKDSNGDRVTAEVKDSTAISNDGREISPGVLRDPKITTEDGAVFRARALLEAAQSNNELVGTKVLPADTLLDPGYQYPVDFGNGDQDKTLEEISLSEGVNQLTLRARFSTPRGDLSRDIQDLRRKGRDISDKV